MFVSINRSLRRSRRQLLTLSALVFVAFAVVSAHSALGGGHMQDDPDVTDALAICFAIGETAAAAFGAAALGRLGESLRFGRVLQLLPARVPVAATVPPGVRARAGPELQVFLT